MIFHIVRTISLFRGNSIVIPAVFLYNRAPIWFIFSLARGIKWLNYTLPLREDTHRPYRSGVLTLYRSIDSVERGYSALKTLCSRRKEVTPFYESSKLFHTDCSFLELELAPS